MAAESENKPLFLELNADDATEATEIESLCMNCHENGYTRLLLTKIPHYKEVVIMSFTCDKCGHSNNEIQSSGQVADRGVRITALIQSAADLNRQVVKSDYTSVRIVELDFEIPTGTQKGEVTTVEGVISRAITGLEQDQVLRRIQHPEAAQQIDAFIEKLSKLKEVDTPFTIILEDCSGNCFVENLKAPQTDPQVSTTHFKRTTEHNHLLGFYTEEEIQSNDDPKRTKSKAGILNPIEEDEYPLENFHGEVLQFLTNCSNCGAPCETNMKMTNIPHFKEVVIMATVCDACGHRSNEVKSGGGIEADGIRIEISVKSREDFSRDVLKSDTCSLQIPEIELDVGPWALGGRFTTVEGLLVAMKNQLTNPQQSQHLMMSLGDSQTPEAQGRMEVFVKRMERIVNGEQEVTIIMDDPAGNSYVQSLRDDNEPDERLKVVKYTRNFEQNEELGLNDMKTENY